MNTEILAMINEETVQGNCGVLCTVIREAGSTPCRPGSSMWVRPDGTTEGTIGGGLVEFQTIEKALSMLRSSENTAIFRKSMTEKDGMACGGEAEIYLEVVGRSDELVIFGGGHVGRAVAELGAFAGFKVTVWDAREEFANNENIPWARNIVCPIDDIYKNGITLHDRSYVLIMTRGHADDAEVVRVTDGQPGIYYGMIGSRGKIARVRQMLLDRGVSAAHLDRIFKPIGLPIKAETPNEIAVSIIAEVIAVKRGADIIRIRGDVDKR